MQNKNHLRSGFFTFLIILSFLVNAVPLKAQDVVTSDDLSGGFIFRASSKSKQNKSAFKNASNVKRTKILKLATSKRIQKQNVIIAKTKPKREKAKEVNPGTIDNVAIARKSKEEASRTLAGAGEYYLNRDDPNNSVDFFNEAMTLDPKNTTAKLGLSEAFTRNADKFIETEKPDAAKTLYLKALELNPKNAGAYAGLSEAYDMLNQTDKALENYEKALALDPDLTELYTPIGVLHYQKGNLAEADKYLTKALATSGDNAETQLFLGLVRYKQNRNEDAAKAFRRAIELDPNSAEAHYYLGEALDALDKNAEAIAQYNEAVRINPKYTEAWFDLGVAYYNSGKYEDSINAYKQTIKLKNNMGEAYANLAEVYRQMNRLDEAIGSYRQAVSFIKDDAELYSKFGYVAGRVANSPGKAGYWNTAIENLNKALALSPDYADYTNLGWAYYNSALSDIKNNKAAEAKPKLQKAKTNLLEAVKINQKFPAAYLNLGMTQSDLGEYAPAIESLKRANDLRKDWFPAVNELGIAYRKNNDFDNAAKYFRRAIEIEPKLGSGYYNLGETEIKRNNMKEAKKAYQKLLELKQNNLALMLEIESKGAVKR